MNSLNGFSIVLRVLPHLLQWKKFSAPPVLHHETRKLDTKAQTYSYKLKPLYIIDRQTCNARNDIPADAAFIAMVLPLWYLLRQDSLLVKNEGRCYIWYRKNSAKMLTSSSKNLHLEQKYFPKQTPHWMQCCATWWFKTNW